MWDFITVGAVLAVCALVIGRRLYRQLKAAFNPAAEIVCGCGCSGGCSASACAGPKEKENGK